MLVVVLSGLVGGCGSGWVRRVLGGLLGVLVFWACCPHGAGGGGLVPGGAGARAAATPGQALAAARPWETPGPARPAGAPARRAGLRCPRRGSPAVRTVCPRVGPSGGERALGQVDAISRTWTRFRPGKRQPERRSPNQKHVHQPLGTLTRTRARPPTQEHAHLKAHGPTTAAVPDRGRHPRPLRWFHTDPHQPPPAYDGPGPTTARPRLLCRWCPRVGLG